MPVKNTKLTKDYLRRSAALTMGILLIAIFGAFAISSVSQREITRRTENVHDLDKVLVSVAEMSVAFEQIRVHPDSQRSEVDQARVSRALGSGKNGLASVEAALAGGHYSEDATRIFHQAALNPIDELTDLFLFADVVADFQRDGVQVAKAASLAATLSRQLIPVLARVSELEVDAMEAASERRQALSVLAVIVALAGIGVAVYMVMLPVERYIVASQEEIEQGRLEALEASRAKSLFLATMSHEIRTPLNGVLGVNQLLLEGETDPERRQMLTLAVSSGNALLQIINDILDLSKIEAGKLELEHVDFDAKRLCQEVVGLFKTQAQGKDIDLTLDVPDDAGNWRVHGSGKQVRQIVLNLVNNAVKFTDGGAISVRLAANLSGPDGARRLRVSVTDTGVGISQDALGRVFDQFEQEDATTTTRFGGTGLGLAIVKQLAEAMGGTVRADSVLGEGSTFSVEVPVGAPKEQAVATVGMGESVSGQLSGRVLVVDDNKVNRLVATKMLENLGCQVRTARDGFEAIDAEAEWRPDVVLMDVRMPKMDGLEATRRIRAGSLVSKGNVPIVGLSANAMDEHRREGLAVGMNGYLTKPLKRDALEAELRLYLAVKSDVNNGGVRCA